MWVAVVGVMVDGRITFNDDGNMDIEAWNGHRILVGSLLEGGHLEDSQGHESMTLWCILRK